MKKGRHIRNWTLLATFQGDHTVLDRCPQWNSMLAAGTKGEGQGNQPLGRDFHLSSLEILLTVDVQHLTINLLSLLKTNNAKAPYPSLQTRRRSSAIVSIQAKQKKIVISSTTTTTTTSPKAASSIQKPSRLIRPTQPCKAPPHPPNTPNTLRKNPLQHLCIRARARGRARAGCTTLPRHAMTHRWLNFRGQALLALRWDYWYGDGIDTNGAPPRVLLSGCHRSRASLRG